MTRASFSHITIKKIRPGRNVRVDLCGIAELADSLRRHGMLQPITVVPTARGDNVEVLFGHRRFAAAKMADFTEVPCFMRGRGDEQSRLLTQLAENFDRSDMSPLEEALAFRDLTRSGLTQMQIATMVHRSNFYVSTRMSVLKYPECVQDAVHRRRISVATALTIPRELLTTKRHEETLGRALELCDMGQAGPLKDWITGRLRAEHRTVEREHRRRRQLEVDLEHYELATKRAKRARKTLYDWTAAMIEAG